MTNHDKLLSGQCHVSQDFVPAGLMCASLEVAILLQVYLSRRYIDVSWQHRFMANVIVLVMTLQIVV